MAFPVPYTPAPSRYDSMPYRRCQVVSHAAVDSPAVLFHSQPLDGGATHFTL
jgi:hypothetical protein